MKCVQTIAGVLAIVGLGYIAGVGHSLLRELPVILGASASTSTQPVPEDNTSAPTIDAPDQQPDPIPAQIDVSETEPTNEFDARLDAAVPDGMLTLRQAHLMWIEGAYFVDSRLRSEYDEGHVSLAAYLTAATIFTNEGDAEMQSIPPDAQVVIYCLGGDECDASLNTKAILEQFGYTDLSIMGVGYDEWAAAGLPTSLTDEEGSP